MIRPRLGPTRLLSALLLGLGLACAPEPARVRPPREGPPNVLVLFVDDLGYADLGVTGNRACPTPSLDSIARNGAFFPNGYSTSCVCSPSRIALLTGRYQQRIGFDANADAIPPSPIQGLDPSAQTFADRLRSAGYVTGLIGKWHVGLSTPDKLPNAHGFDEFYGILSHGTNPRPPFTPVWRNTEPEPIPSNHTQAFGKEARSFIERHASAPWFLYCAFTAVHSPHEAPGSYHDRFSDAKFVGRSGYLATLALLDDVVGEILEKLREEGLEENTLIFLASDNGGELPFADNGPFRGEKWTLLEGGIRAPVLVQWKGHVPAGSVHPEIVTQLDFLPTALSAAGVPIRPEWELDGADLLPLMRGETQVAPHPALFWRFGVQNAVREGNWKLVKSGLNEPTCLYDLEQDPGETRDLSASQVDEVRHLTELYDAWNARNEPPRWNDQRWNSIEEALPFRESKERTKASR